MENQKNLEKSANCKVVSEKSVKIGKSLLSQGNIISFCRPASANTLNNEMEF